jgi:hypothetical protein
MRLRARTVSEAETARRAACKALASGEWAYALSHGGSVANSYGYRAFTETVVAVSDPEGRVAVWKSTAPANKVGGRAVAMSCLPVLADLVDERVKNSVRKKDAWRGVCQAHSQALAAGELFLRVRRNDTFPDFGRDWGVLADYLEDQGDERAAVLRGLLAQGAEDWQFIRALLA